VAAYFEGKGFRVGPLLGISMSVEGERARFEESLGIELDRLDDGGWMVHGAVSDLALHLPTSELPDAVADHLADLVLDTLDELHDELHDGPDTSV
jgi:hypothetical protein